MASGRRGEARSAHPQPQPRREATSLDASFGIASTASFVNPEELKQETMVRVREDKSESDEFGDFEESGWGLGGP